jgi:hypothetical protein
MQAAIEASREILRTGKIPPPDKDAPPPRGFNPEEINPPVSTKGGMTALLHAARQGNLEAADALLKGGADINKVNAGDGTSALLTAIINGEFDMAMLLIKSGANPNLAAKNNGVDPLWAAANAPWQPRTRFPQPQEMERQKATYLEVMQALLDKGADVNHRITSHPWYLVYTGCGNRNCGLADTSGSTAFWRAAYGTDLMAMKLLVAYGADPDIPTIAPQQQVRRGPPPERQPHQPHQEHRRPLPLGNPQRRDSRPVPSDSHRAPVAPSCRLQKPACASTTRRSFRTAAPASSPSTPRPALNTAKALPATRIATHRMPGSASSSISSRSCTPTSTCATTTAIPRSITQPRAATTR